MAVEINRKSKDNKWYLCNGLEFLRTEQLPFSCCADEKVMVEKYFVVWYRYLSLEMKFSLSNSISVTQVFEKGTRTFWLDVIVKEESNWFLRFQALILKKCC